MIDLTPLEVRQKKGDFHRAFRGYDRELVNDFLDLVADRMEELVKENMALRDQAERTDRELTAFREKERDLSQALMAAQKLREDARSHAEKEGELIVREARLAGDAAREEARRKLVAEEDALRQVRARRAQLVESFRRLLERELAELAVIEETLELRGQAGGRGGSRVASEQRKAKSEGSRAGRSKAEASADAAEGDGSDGDVQEDWLSSLAEEQQAE